MNELDIAIKYVRGQHDALTDKQEIKDMAQDILDFAKNYALKQSDNIDLGDVRHSEFFSLSTTTSFTEDELIDYAILTGKKLPEIEKIMAEYTRYGLYSLWEINLIIRMGHYCA